MDPRPGCLPLLVLALILGFGALLVGVTSEVSVEATAAPMVEASPAP
jgi:hypothetical protein